MRRLTPSFAVFLALFATASSEVLSASMASLAAQFDGRWDVTLSCPSSADGAGAFNFDLSGSVKGGVLHAEHGTDGQPGWLTLDGSIQPNGDASLQAHGLTGMSPYNINQTGRGVPYMHPVTSHFDGASGSGYWVTTRRCDFTFKKL